MPRHTGKNPRNSRAGRDARRPRAVWRDCVRGFLGLCPEAGLGDYVMVHVGFAISRVDASEAERTYKPAGWSAASGIAAVAGVIVITDSRFRRRSGVMSAGIALGFGHEVSDRVRDHRIARASAAADLPAHNPASGCCMEICSAADPPYHHALRHRRYRCRGVSTGARPGRCPVCVTPLETVVAFERRRAEPGPWRCHRGS